MKVTSVKDLEDGLIATFSSCQIYLFSLFSPPALFFFAFNMSFCQHALTTRLSHWADFWEPFHSFIKLPSTLCTNQIIGYI